MPDEPKEKLDFLKREDIRTMQKDIKRLKEEEALKARGELSTLKVEEVKKEGVARIEIIPKRAEAEVITEERKLSKPPSKFEKILIRLIVIFIILLIIISAFWYFGVKKAGIKIPQIKISELRLPQINFHKLFFWVKETPQPTLSIIPSISPIITPTIIPSFSPTPTESPLPPSLILVGETKILTVNNAAEISLSLEQLLKENWTPKTFIRIFFKDSNTNQLFTLKEIFSALGINASDSFYQKLDSNFTLFVYSQEEGKRIGFVSKIGDQGGFKNLIQSWEPNMEKDFKNIFSMMDKWSKASMPYFQNAKYNNVYFRYQTFSVPHFGICYLIYNDYFVFTSSGKSMMKIIDQLTK